MARRPPPHGRYRARVVAASDCEHCREGAITQPANAVSSLAYVVAGAALLRRERADRAFASAVIGVGLGSVAYHGPGGVVGRWAHDASLLAMLGLLTLSDVTVVDGRKVPPAAVGAMTGAAAVAAHPRTTDIAQGMAGALAAVAEARRYRRRSDLRELAVSLPLWTVGLSLHIIGRTDRPLCRPDSLAQPHAAWHVMSAAALWTRRRF